MTRLLDEWERARPVRRVSGRLSVTPWTASRYVSEEMAKLIHSEQVP